MITLYGARKWIQARAKLLQSFGGDSVSPVGVTQSVEHLSYHMLRGTGMLDPGLEPHQILYASMWMKQFS